MTMTTLYVELTEAQANALCSLAEMTVDRAPLTFADWAESNGKSLRAVANAQERLEYAIKDGERVRRGPVRLNSEKVQP